MVKGGIVVPFASVGPHEIALVDLHYKRSWYKCPGDKIS